MSTRIDPDLQAHVLPLLPGAGWRLTPLADGHNLVLRARRAGEDLVVRLQPEGRMRASTAAVLVETLRTLARDPDLRVPSPVRLAGGDWVGRVEHAGCAWHGYLVTWVAGDRAPDATSFVEPERLHAIGATVARLHEHARHVPAGRAQAVPHLEDALRLDALDDQALRASLPRDLHARLDAACRRLAAALRELAVSGEVGLVHADLEPQNWVFEEGRPGVIDFDELRYGAFAVDLHGVLWTHALWDDLPRFRHDLFAGYERVRPLPPGTREHTDRWMAAQLASWIAFLLREVRQDRRLHHLDLLEPVAERIVGWCEAD